MAKPDSKLRVGSRVKHPHFGAGKITMFLHGGSTAVIETVEKGERGKPSVTHTHYVKTSELKRIEAEDGN